MGDDLICQDLHLTPKYSRYATGKPIRLAAQARGFYRFGFHVLLAHFVAHFAREGKPATAQVKSNR